jgi:hypothetical protein
MPFDARVNEPLPMEIIYSSWVTKLLFSERHRGLDLDQEGQIWDSFYWLAKRYIKNLRKLMYAIELVTFTTAVSLANTGFLICGILVGVFGIVTTGRMSELQVKLMAHEVAVEKIREQKREEQSAIDRDPTL